MVLAFLFEMNTGAAYACTPFPPTPWFITTVGLASLNLPQGISAAELGQGSLKLQNQSAGKIEIPIASGYTGKNGYEEILPGDAGYLSWETQTFGGTKVHQEVLLANSYVVGGFEPRNVIADNRPVNPKIPEPRIVPFRFLFNGQPLDLQLRITYKLNEQYVNNSVYSFSHACEAPELRFFGQLASIGGFICIWISALLAGIYVYRRSRQKEMAKAKTQ